MFKNWYSNNIDKFDKFIYKQNYKSARRNFLSVSFAIILALFFSFVIITSLGTRPTAFFQIFVKIFQWDYSTERFVYQICTYILAALAFSVCFKVGLFNIGINAQMLAGSSFAFLIINQFPKDFNPEFGGEFITIILAIFGSVFVAGLIGVLKVYFKVNEVVSSILLNWIVLLIVGALIRQYDLDASAFGNGAFKSNTLATAFAFRKTNELFGWKWSVIVTIIALLVVFIIMRYSVFGQKLKTTGNAFLAARNFGYNNNYLQISAFLISGVLAGLLACVVYTASFDPAITFDNNGGVSLNALNPQGFDGIAIALISLNNPIAIVIVSFIFAFPNVGAIPANLPSNTINLIVGIMMYLIAIYSLLTYFKPWKMFLKRKYFAFNIENWNDLENSLFDLNEKYQFDLANVSTKTFEIWKNQKGFIYTNNTFNHILNFLIFLPYWKLIGKYFNQAYKQEKQLLFDTYVKNRTKLVNAFYKKLIFSSINYFENYQLTDQKSFNQDIKKWIITKNYLIKWKALADQNDLEINSLDFEAIHLKIENNLYLLKESYK